MKMKMKLLALTAVLGIAAFASSGTRAEAVNVRPCDTACPTSDGLCNCPTWTDRPKALAFCTGWNRVGSCWYE
jgi:hypothetical protein